jgi:hypothetical protein
MPSSLPKSRFPVAAVLFLIALGVAYRVAVPLLDLPQNTAPLVAIAFGGSLLLGLRLWWVPVAALLASDLILGLILPGGGPGGYTIFSAAFLLLASAAGALLQRDGHRWLWLWSGTLIGSVAFYLLANTYSWLFWPGYEKSLAGWWQSQTIGQKGFYPPAWFFLRNSLIANTIWCGLAAAVYAFTRITSAKPGGNPAPVGR